MFRFNDRRVLLSCISLALLLSVGVLSVGAFRVSATVNTFRPCDVIAGIGNSQFNWLRPDVCPGVPGSLTLVSTLNDGSGSTFTRVRHLMSPPVTLRVWWRESPTPTQVSLVYTRLTLALHQFLFSIIRAHSCGSVEAPVHSLHSQNQ